MSAATTDDLAPWASPGLAVQGWQQTSAPMSRAHRLSWSRRHWRLELVSVLAFDAVYESVRSLAPAHRDLAFANAAKIMDVERWAHLDIELPLNRALTGHPALGSAFGYYYSSFFFAVTPIMLAWLWARRPDSYAQLRSALVLSTFVALVGYWMFPVAPPRFALPGATDTLVSRNVLGAASPHSIAGLINNYAAMPSLHVAWATWCAFAVVLATRSRWRHLSWLYPATTTLVVLATANHYVLDAVAGFALVAAGVWLARPRSAARAPSSAARTLTRVPQTVVANSAYGGPTLDQMASSDSPA